MPDENAVTVGGDQASSTVQGNQISSTQQSQTNNDFVLDFGEGSTSEESKSNSTDINENIDSSIESDEQYDENQKGDENVEGLTDNEELSNKDDSFSVNETKDSESLNNDFDISLDDTTDENPSNYDSFDLSGNEEDTIEENSDFQIDLDSSDEIGNQDNESETLDNSIQNNTENEEPIVNDIQNDSENKEPIVDDIQNDSENEEPIVDDTNTGNFIVDDTLDSPIKNEINDIDEEDNTNKITNNEDSVNIEYSDETETIENSEDFQKSDNLANDNTSKNLYEESDNHSNGDILEDSSKTEISLNSETGTEGTTIVNERNLDDNIQSTNDIQDNGYIQNNMIQDNTFESESDVVTNEDGLFKKDDSQILNFDQPKINSQSESSIEEQPDIQNYKDNQPSFDNFQPLNENEESDQSKDSLDLNSNSSEEENSFENDSNNSESQQYSQNISFSLDPQPKQENLVNNENTSNGFYLNSTGSEEVSPSAVQDTNTTNLMQEKGIPTSINEGENISNETDNIKTIKEFTENNVSTQKMNQAQPTLSLDQILDSEILSNPKYSDNSVVISKNTAAKNSSFLSNKIGTIFVGIGILILAGLVAILAFPSRDFDRKPGDSVDTGNINNLDTENVGHFSPNDDSDVNFPDPDINLPEPDITLDSKDQDSSIYSGAATTSVVEFPDAFDDDLYEEVDNDKNNIAIPYIGNDDFEYENEELGNEGLLADIISSISSSKSEAEMYYSYGQEISDKKIIKYALQIINKCDDYENRISLGEGINYEDLSKFENYVNEITMKINSYNNGGDEVPLVSQNNIESNEEDYDYTEKEELREYLYNR